MGVVGVLLWDCYECTGCFFYLIGRSHKAHSASLLFWSMSQVRLLRRL